MGCGWTAELISASTVQPPALRSVTVVETNHLQVLHHSWYLSCNQWWVFVNIIRQWWWIFFFFLNCDQDTVKVQLDECCRALSQLIHDQLFLRSMVHALEEQKSFNVKDKYVFFLFVFFFLKIYLKPSLGICSIHYFSICYYSIYNSTVQFGSKETHRSWDSTVFNTQPIRRKKKLLTLSKWKVHNIWLFISWPFDSAQPSHIICRSYAMFSHTPTHTFHPKFRLSLYVDTRDKKKKKV